MTLNPERNFKLCEQCRRIRLDNKSVTLVITKSRKEIELSATSNCHICKFLQWQSEKADYFETPDPIKIQNLFRFEQKILHGSWDLRDDPYRRNEYHMVDRNEKGISFTFEFYRQRDGSIPAEDYIQFRDISPTPQHCFALAKHWIDICTNTHPACALKSTSMPARLLNVSNQNPFLQLTLSLSNVRYAALSHCWGTKPLLTTTSESLSKRLKCIPIPTLPKSFQDAVVVTRALGLDFLWIDSLCIIQDSDTDWRTESSKMQQYYQEAFVTISALSASGSHDGFLTSRLPRTQLKLDQENLFFRSPRTSRYDLMDRSPIAKRAWTLQEQLLSTRILHFGSDELLWECSTCTWRESDVVQEARKNPEFGGLEGEMFKPILSDIEYLSLSREQAVARWLNVIHEYSGRLLTKNEDRLPAISGLATIVQKSTGYKYLAGLWSEEMRKGLTWGRDCRDDSLTDNSSSIDVPQTISRQYIAPSWSWASIVEPVRFRMYWANFHYPLGKRDMEFVSGSTSTVGSDPLGQVTDGSIKIRAWSKEANYSPDPEGVEWPLDLFLRCKISIRHKLAILGRRDKVIKIKAGMAVLDDVTKEKSTGSCLLVRITERVLAEDKRDQLDVIYCLMITKDISGTGKWKRIGLAELMYADIESEVTTKKGSYDFEDWKWGEFEII